MANSTALPPISEEQWEGLLKAGILAEYMSPEYHHLKMKDVIDHLLDGTHNLTAIFGEVFTPSNASTVLGALKAYLPSRPHNNMGYPNSLSYYIGGGIAIVVVCTRLYGRKCITKVVRREDWFALVVLGFAIILSVACAMANGLGYANAHLYDISYSNLVTNMKYVFACEILYSVAICAVRFQVLIFYLGLSPAKIFRWAVFFAMAFNFASFAAGTFSVIFQCKPIAWWLVPLTAKCINRVRAWVTFAAVGIATDLLTLMIPMPVVWGLQMNKREKLFVCALFGVGCMVWVGSINRLRTINQFITAPDVTYTEGILGMWSIVEIDLAIIASSVPALKTVARKHFPWLLGRAKHTPSQVIRSRSSSRRRFNGGAGDTGKAGAWKFFQSRKDTCLQQEGTGITVSTGVTITIDDVEKGSEGNLTMPEAAKYNTWSRMGESSDPEK